MGGFSTYKAWVGTLWAQYLGIYERTFKHPATFCARGI